MLALLITGALPMQAQTADSTEVEKLDAIVAEESATDATEDVDVNALVFGHIGDAYEWHIVTIGDTSIRIPLPVIVKSSTGWHCFSSSRLEEGETYEGLYMRRYVRWTSPSLRTYWDSSSTVRYWWSSC